MRRFALFAPFFLLALGLTVITTGCGGTTLDSPHTTATDSGDDAGMDAGALVTGQACEAAITQAMCDSRASCPFDAGSESGCESKVVARMTGKTCACDEATLAACTEATRQAQCVALDTFGACGGCFP